MSLESSDNLLGQAEHLEAWRLQTAELGGPNPLRNFEPNSWSQIDLTKPHPGGLAQFISTGSVRLSNLVRDPLALSRSTNSARRIHAKSLEISHSYGVRSIYLVGGLAAMQSSGFDLSLPILMWPLSLTETADDYQITKIGEAKVNPELVLAFLQCFDVKIDESKLLSKLADGSDLLPMSVLEYLSDLGSGSGLDLKRVLTLANFVPELAQIRTSQIDQDSPLIAQLLGAPDPQRESEVSQSRRMADLDGNQLAIIQRALTGESFAVEALAGCGYTQTVAAMIANLGLQGKRVLVVANRMQTVDEISQRLASFGLAGLVARSNNPWMDVVAGISRNEKAAAQNLDQTAEALESVDAELDSYRRMLTNRSEDLQVSILDCMTQLAQLAAMPHAPVAQARISASALRSRDRYQTAVDQLFAAEKSEIFKFGPAQSAWFGAKFASQDEINQTLSVVRRLRDSTFPQLTSKLTEFINASEFKPADSVSKWGIYLRLFVGLRETLDRLSPEVFDRPLDDLIAATADRKTKTQLSGKTRRRLKKLAKEFIRPGMVVSDINEALRAAKTQLELWNEYSTSLKPPMVPAGINDALVSFQALVTDLNFVQAKLPDSQDLQEISLDLLSQKLDSLCDDTQPLIEYFEKAQILQTLESEGLTEVVSDFARLNVKPEHLVAEFDQVWWQSALEALIALHPQFVEFDQLKITELEQQYRRLDEELLGLEKLQVAFDYRVAWEQALAKNPGQVEIFRAVLKSGRANLSELLRQAPDLLFAVSPALAMPALEVATTVESQIRFDTLILLDAASATIGENLHSLAMAKQVIGFGDEVVGAAHGFSTEPQEHESKVSQINALHEIAERFGSEVLRVNYRSGGQLLGSFINREFYQNRIIFEPTAADYFDRSVVKVNLITEGSNASTSAEGANESLDTEVIKTVELVFNHAVWHPEDSLLVATASELHAERVRASIASGLRARADLQTWFESHGSERFEVSSLSKLRHRIADRVIFSVGFGKSQHGAMLSNFGDLSTEDGRRALANLLVSARKELHVVSCFAPNDFSKERMGGAVGYLKDLLEVSLKPHVESSDIEPNPLLADLALRLRKLGVTVRFGFGHFLPMIVSYSNQAMVLVPDWMLHGDTPSEQYRLRPTLIESLGWKYQRITSFELFSDPKTMAERIARDLGISVRNAGQQSFEVDWSSESNINDRNERFDSNDSRLKSDKPPHWG